MADRMLASIGTVTATRAIVGRDRIEMVQVDNGWWVLAQKGLYKEGGTLVYFEVDSVLPPDERWNCDLERYNFRVRAMKMAGEVSQGYTMPISKLTATECRKPKAGTDLTAALKVTKYEPDVWNRGQSIPRKKGRGLLSFLRFNKAFRTNPYHQPFPSFINKTDECRVQRMHAKIEASRNTDIFMTEKLHGSSMTAFLKDGEFGVCSRNLKLLSELPTLPTWKQIAMKVGMFKQERMHRENSEGPVTTHFWRLAIQENLEKKFRNVGRNIALQGEIIGPGIQKNEYQLDKLELYIFNGWDIDGKRYLDFNELKDLCRKMNLYTVPFLGWVNLQHSVDELVKMADGKSELNPATLREGFVARCYDMKLSFKSVSEKWLLSQA
jgi:hypothetical protein